MKLGRMGIPGAGLNSIQLDPSDSTMSAEAGTEPWTVATFALVLEALTTQIDLIHLYRNNCTMHIQQLQITDP
jgi:hypothetical protein